MSSPYDPKWQQWADDNPWKAISLIVTIVVLLWLPGFFFL